MAEFHRNYDLLLTPMMPVPALPVGQDLNDPATERHWIDWSPFSYPFNLTRQPAASIPCGLTGAGLPIGLQIVGPLYADDRVLRAAHAFEVTQPNDGRPLRPERKNNGNQRNDDTARDSCRDLRDSRPRHSMI